MYKFFYYKILPIIIKAVYSLYMKSVNYSIPLEKVPSYPVIFAHFHQDELMLIYTGVGKGYATLTSTSKDGELMTKVLNLMGFTCIRGSSNKKPVAALLNMINFLIKTNSTSVMAVDGPKGPIYKVKNGVLMLSKKTGFPIIPLVAKPSNAYCISSSWNKALIPKPFSKVEILFGKEIRVPSEESDLDSYKNILEADLLKLKNII